MISKISWRDEFTRELERATSARSQGNEGMARVCARRAAGIVVGEYLQRHGVSILNNSAYDRLSILIEMPEVDDQCRRVCRHFLMKVNQEHKLPVEADLIREATWLENNLLDDSN